MALSFLATAVLFFLLNSSLFLFLLYTFSSPSRRLPLCPKPFPAVGKLLTMLRNKPHFRWVLRTAAGKDITCIRLGRVHVVVVNSPAIARECLKKHDAAFASRPLTMATEYSGRGFLSAVISPVGDQWKKMRRVLASEVIQHAKLRQMAPMRAEEADDLVGYINYQCKNSGVDAAVIDIRLAVRYYSGNVIRRMLFGCRRFGKGPLGGGPGPGEEEIEHVETAFAVLSLIYAFCASDFLPELRALDLDGHEKIMREAIGVINKYHDPIIEERIRRRRVDGGGKEEPEDILDVFISLKDGNGKPLLTVEEIKAQTAELVYATVDNPSNIAEWALAEMLNQPDLLRRAVDELDRVVGRNSLVQESDFPSLPFIKACAREALRLHPVAPFNLPHVATADATVCGYFIPKGSQVLLSRVGLGRNPDVWDNPLRFNPDRHVERGEVELAEPELRFISFTTGRRGCAGSSLGSLMTYMLLARLLQAFTWSLPPDKTAVKLAEEEKSLFMAEPLRLVARPRLPLLLEQP